MSYYGKENVHSTRSCLITTAASGAIGKIFMATQVCSGYPKKTGLTVPCALPANLNIRDHNEFAFSNWISDAYVLAFIIVAP
jgi:hypothetical protein